MSNLQAHYLVHDKYNISSRDAIAEEKPGKWWDIDAITHHLISRRSNDCMCIHGGHIEANKKMTAVFRLYFLLWKALQPESYFAEFWS